MKPIRSAFVFSLLFHTGLLVLFYVYVLPVHRARHSAEITFAGAAPAAVRPAIATSRPPQPLHAARARIDRPEPAAPAVDPVPLADETLIEPPADPAVAATTTPPPFFAPRSYSRFYLHPDSLRLSGSDSLKENMRRHASLALYTGPRQGHDRVAEDTYRRNMGQTGPVPLDALIGAGAQALGKLLPEEKPAPVRLTRAPTHSQIAALRAIWETGEATQKDIYAQIDPRLPLTARDLDLILEQMTGQGWLTRTLISPSDEFTFMSPMGGVGVEKSGLNRRNRVYRYRSLIDRDHVMNYLQARLYEQRGKSGSDSTRILQRLIMRMMAERP